MKYCKFDTSKRCYHSCCSIFDKCSGNVVVYPLHSNPSGFLMFRYNDGILFAVKVVS